MRASYFIVVVCLVGLGSRGVQAQEKKEQKVAPWRKALKDPDDQVRVKAIISLAQPGIDARVAIDDLIGLLQTDKAPGVRIAAAKALSMICYHTRPIEPEKKLISALIQAMHKDTDTVVRWTACGSFAMIGKSAKDAAPFLLAAMKDKEDSRMRELAGHSLEYVASPQCAHILPRLVEMYSHGIEEEPTEITVLAVIGKIGSSEKVTVPLLLSAMNSRKPERLNSRRAAARALGYMGPKGKAAIPGLIGVLKESLKLQRDDPRNMRGTAVEALGRIGAKEALPLLESIVSDAEVDLDFRRVAKEALKRIRSNKEKPKLDVSIH